MQYKSNVQVRVLKLFELLLNEASQSAPLGTQVILQRLKMQGLTISMATLKRDIELLCECGFDVRSVDTPAGESFYIAKPPVRVAEAPAVRSDAASCVIESVRNKTQISITLDSGGEFTVSPYAVFRDGTGYYAACFSPAHRRMILLPFSKLRSVKVTGKPGDSPPPDYSVQYYTIHGFKLCQSANEKVTLSFDADLLDSVLTQFGADTDIKYSPSGTLHAVVNTEVSPSLFTWVFCLGGRVRIVSPDYVCGEYKSCLRAQLAAY